MQKELSTFTAFALQNADDSIEDLWNRFIQSVPPDKVAQISGHYILFLQTAERARFAPKSVKKILE